MSAREALAATAVIVFVACTLQVFAGAARVGISTDEPKHQSRMNVRFETGWYVPALFIEDGRPSDELTAGRRHAYGAGYGIFGHAVAVIAGAESPGETNRSAEAYTARGIAVALLGVASALAVGYAIGVLTGLLTSGLWAAAATMAMPLWAGYSMFAVKDIPAAAGWTFVTAGLVAAMKVGHRCRRPMAVAMLTAVGVWFSVGVRTALWVPVAVGAITFVALAAARTDRAALVPNAAAVAGGLLAGMTAVAALHPRNSTTPVEWLASAVRLSGDFHWTGATLTAGHLVTEKPPWWYLPAWIGGSVPLLIGVLAVIGVTAATAAVLRGGAAPGGPWRRHLGHPDAGMALWGIQALMLPIVATVGGATMYAGLRQHLYVLPALAALAAYAAHRLMTAARARSLVAIALAAALVAPAVEQSQLFPYQFVYKNVAAGPINDRWETDMHFVSAREALSRIPEHADAWCYTRSLHLLSGDVRKPRLTSCTSHRLVAPFAEEQGRTSVELEEPDGLWVIGRKYRGSPPAEGCHETANITRKLRTEEVVLSYVLRCDPGEYDK